MVVGAGTYIPVSIICTKPKLWCGDSAGDHASVCDFTALAMPPVIHIVEDQVVTLYSLLPTSVERLHKGLDLIP